jgi:type 1 glutamine amidotransferase
MEVLMRCWRLLGWLSVSLLVVAPTGDSQEQAEGEKIRAVLWVGGFAHDFDAFAAITTEFLPQRIPLDMEVVRDGSFLDAPAADTLDVIVMNHCFESAEGVLNETQKQKLLDLIRGGVGVVAIHASYYSFLKWDAVRELYGARFTQHGSSDAMVDVRMVDRAHPITRDLPETFRIRTELYESTPLAEDCHVLALAREEGKQQEHPSVWTRQYGKGRVVTILPAHWPEAYRVAEFQQLIANSTRWAAARRDEPQPPEEMP